MERRNMSTIWILLAVLVVLVGLYMSGMFGSLGAKSETEYQAVFLSNGQVYFGKVTNEAGDLVKVEDIYYLRVQQQVQPAEGEAAAQPEVKLVKLGNEIHGPLDAMRINREHVLFVEDLKEDGKVVTAIRNFQRNGETDTPGAVDTTPTTPAAE